jgi:hypothetical protein
MKKFIRNSDGAEGASASSYFRRVGSVVMIAVCALAATGISAAERTGPPNLEGVWDRADGSTSDLFEYLKKQGIDIPFTALGAERYRNIDVATNPNGYCFPPGPSRMITGPSPLQIVQGQNNKTIAFLKENHGVYRIIHMDREDFPEEILENLEYMGHSFGKWDGDVLVIDTVGMREETWLDTAGLQHSANMRLTETFALKDPDTIHYTMTIDDPEFYARPWTVEADYERTDTRILEYVCGQNEKDLENLVPTFPNRDLDLKVFPGEK